MRKKDVYNEVGVNYRYFLDWRHKILAGYLVTVAALAIGFSWAITNYELKPHSWILLMLGVIISIVFWLLDYRNRHLYHTCQEVGAKIEASEGILDGQGIYSELMNSNSKLSHSVVLNIMFFLATIVFAFAAIVAYKIF